MELSCGHHGRAACHKLFQRYAVLCRCRRRISPRKALSAAVSLLIHICPDNLLPRIFRYVQRKEPCEKRASLSSFALPDSSGCGGHNPDILPGTSGRMRDAFTCNSVSLSEVDRPDDLHRSAYQPQQQKAACTPLRAVAGRGRKRASYASSADRCE